MYGHQTCHYLAIFWSVLLIAIEIWSKHQDDQAHTRNCHTCNHRVEHCQQFLQPKKVPRCFRRIRSLIEIRSLQQRRVDKPRKHESERRACKRRDKLDTQQVRPGVHFVDRHCFDILNRARFNNGQQSLRMTTRSGTKRHAAIRGCCDHSAARLFGNCNCALVAI